MQADSILWRSHALVDKWDADQTRWMVERLDRTRLLAADFHRAGIRPETVEAAGNLLTTAGLTRLTSLLTAGGGQAITNTSVRLGVGDGAGTAAAGDTDLSAAVGTSHRYFQTMDATYPTVSGGTLTFKATYGSGDANFAWSEWGIDIGAPTVSAGTTVNACLLNHKTGANLGTKTSGGTWALTATIAIS